MSYYNWKDSDAHRTIRANWFEVADLMKALQKVKRDHFDCTTEAYAAAQKTIFIDTPHSAPYSELTRFPADNKYYICDGLPKFKSRFVRLRVLCMRANDPGQFRKLILELIDDVAWRPFYIDREGFEKWSNLYWVDTDQPVPSSWTIEFLKFFDQKKDYIWLGLCILLYCLYLSLSNK